MADLSGRKYPVYKMCDLVPKSGANEGSNSIGTTISLPRSLGKKHQPVRISTMHFDDLAGSRHPGSSRKTGDLTLRKPIRNIHKLLESPKRSVRKRLDNLYDFSKSKENVYSTPAKGQALSSRKIAPKTPSAAAILNPRSIKKTELIKPKENSRQSRLLPPGTITGSYINKRNSTAVRTSLFRPVNNPLPIRKSLHVKRPSDVPEETSESLEKLEDSNNPVTNAMKTEISGDVKSSSVKDVPKEKETPVRCCDCLRALVDSDSSDNAPKLPNENVKDLENAKDIAERDKDAKEEEKFQRPTVIVRQKEAATLTMKGSDLDGSLILPIDDGLYSEVLSLRPSMNSTEKDESLLFRNIETNCFQTESAVSTDQENEMWVYICKLINKSEETLVVQQKHLTKSIAQQEKITASLKLMLESVNSQLHMQKTIRSHFNSKGWSNLSDAELLLVLRCNDGRALESDPKKNCANSSKENEEHREENAVSEAASSKSKTAKSANEEPQLSNAADLLKNKLNTDRDETGNIENEPPTRRRSARLATKQARLSSPGGQDTPSKEEPKSKDSAGKFTPCTPRTATPARGGRWGRRSERPLREYMVLKSAIKCLNTPDSRRYRIGADGKVQVRDSLSKTAPDVGLTDKLVMELHDLYAATP